MVFFACFDSSRELSCSAGRGARSCEEHRGVFCPVGSFGLGRLFPMVLARPPRLPFVGKSSGKERCAIGFNHLSRFRSSDFRQQKTGEDALLLTDQRSGHSFRSPVGVSKDIPWPDGRMQNDQGRMNLGYPTHLHVERRRRTPDTFNHIVRPLRSVLQASIETGNPVQWR